eukprot:2034742-Prymnesium_polylepis.2
MNFSCRASGLYRSTRVSAANRSRYYRHAGRLGAPSGLAGTYPLASGCVQAVCIMRVSAV